MLVSCSALLISVTGYGAVQDTAFTKWYATFPLKEFKLNSAYGIRVHPVTGERYSFHKGIDIAGKNEIVVSLLPGIIDKIGYTSIMGNYVAIRYGGYVVYYAHLSKIYCCVGLIVPTGYPIGLTGSTGRTTGEHLHLSVLRDRASINPLYFLMIILSISGAELKHYLYGG
ncbi:murein DD-endopeptidase MepM/ murein hydrolase activator NlpD [Pedobacter sp. W3I1]|uniref:M23 family metallopeptidase n=1 Tax=Pedobacter sp. W3I1 TaxID=3042291 RepID=UPI002785E505|nr:M23 family metallopeptidase [Pedobacter sp. W3I1]MDQ0640147.1 murein DD-endopeptidase MepM/ murein hydrolase activator NlpD [Pedobacter sp. W3I1]